MNQLRSTTGLRARKGQALVEYALTALVVISVFFVINTTVKRGIGGLWKAMARNIVAGCPGCEVPTELN